MIDRSPKRCGRTRRPDPAAAGLCLSKILFLVWASVACRRAAATAVRARRLPTSICLVSTAKTFWRRCATSPSTPGTASGPPASGHGGRIEGGSGMRKRRPGGISADPAASCGSARRRACEKGGPGAPEERRPFGGKKAASKRKECRGPKRGMPRFVRQAGAKSPSRALRAHCRRTRQERRAFGGPDPAGLQARTIFPRPRQAASNFWRPRPPRRLCPPSSTLT